MEVRNDSYIMGRKLDFYAHESGEECGYTKTQTDSFAVLHPLNEEQGKTYPLYVVLHSAGHSLHSTLGTLEFEGNHDIYHAPTDMYALYLDCYAHRENDWWWGGVDANGNWWFNCAEPSEKKADERKTTTLQPVEKRVLNCVKWTKENFPIDENRVYLVGNSMGGTGTLGIGFNHGDIFAALIANVPAGCEHINNRCLLTSDETINMPEPPVVVDYSAQDDVWSTGHEKLYNGTQKHKFALVGYWGPFGHENNMKTILGFNDLVMCYNPLNLKKNEAYPAFTSASTDDIIPWPDKRDSKDSGQVNAFFRWSNKLDSKEEFKMNFRLLNNTDWETKVELPKASNVDVTLRRIQNFYIKPNEEIKYSFGSNSGKVVADKNGKVTINLDITQEEQTLSLTKE